jgi:hypothetical protein
MTLWKYVIAGVGKSGFRPTRFSPHNSPPAAMYPFVKTVVEIAGPLKEN